MDTGRYYIPKYLDEPFRIVIFTLDEFIITMVPLALVWGFCNELLGIALGVFVYFSYIKFKRRESSAYFKRKLYWAYGMARHLNVMPNHHTKHLKG